MMEAPSLKPGEILKYFLSRYRPGDVPSEPEEAGDSALAATVALEQPEPEKSSLE